MKLEGQEVKLELKTLAVTEVKVLDEQAGIIEAYVSIFGNIDSYGDIVEKGAFAESIANNFPRYPKGVWAHDWTMPIAKTLEIREDERGLYVKGQLLLDIQKAKEAYVLIKEGVMTDFSFGYQVDESQIDENTGIRHLKKITIFEWSPVLVGANSRATLIGVKSDGQEILEPEEDELLNEEDLDEQKNKEEKTGRVLSEKNRELIQSAMEEIQAAQSGLTKVYQTFDALLKATETPSDDTDEGKTAVDQRDKSKIIKTFLLRDARQALKAQKRLLLRVTRIIN